MSRSTFSFHDPDRFVSGTIGQPGQRAFYLQAREGNRIVSVLCEKEQVQVLAEHLERILDELTKLVDQPQHVAAPVTVADDLDPLDQPLDEEFRVGSMSLAWDSGRQKIAIELFSVDDEDESGDSVDVRLSTGQARQFVARSKALVESGRPACPFCLQPINPDGHICPRANGYRRPLFARE
jgi:uncharacterized repeat protein (TIGR03847 family)